ncbi:hypothetical protein BX285_6551 [Streptomyces sp. 1114.5]|nr:hypothetical protein BX285_6551 [Streptomyces sp. 1114.5]SOB88540.1 hypothetical protein SAMN06272789_6825 [Streptomyces sp. 1331.2]
MRDQDHPVPKEPTTPKEPPVSVETPESRMTGEGAPPPGHEEEKGPQDGPEYEVTEPAAEPAATQEPPD